MCAIRFESRTDRATRIKHRSSLPPLRQEGLIMTLRDDLETVISSDPVMAEDRMAGIISLARAVADQADAQLSNTGALESRIIASYGGMLAQINRTIRDDRDRRRRTEAKTAGKASRLSLIRQQAAEATKVREEAW
ncbi:hypothetical protein [Microbacterium lacticum]|nr:hypothetical protein [Microbacterium lacticum]